MTGPRTHLPAQPEWQLVSRPLTLREFEQLPWTPSYVLSSLWDLGFDDTVVLDALRAGAGLPTAYRPREATVKVVDVPVRSALRTGTPVTFRLLAPGAAEGAVINDSRWTYMARQGDYLEATVTPARGELKVSLRTDLSQRTYWTLLTYQVQ